MYFRNIRTLNAAFKETGDMHMSQKIYGKSEICYPGVEVKALCPSWADTEIVSGVKEEIKVNMSLVFSFDHLLQSAVNNMVSKMGGLMPVEYVAEALHRSHGSFASCF